MLSSTLSGDTLSSQGKKGTLRRFQNTRTCTSLHAQVHMCGIPKKFGVHLG